MEEKVLEAMQELGFKLEKVDDTVYTFGYENLDLMLCINDNDEGFLSISVPGILGYEGEDKLEYLEVMSKINSNLKYVKAYSINDNIWLFYERELMGNEDLPVLLSRMIFCLENAVQFIKQVMDEAVGEMTEEEDLPEEDLLEEDLPEYEYDAGENTDEKEEDEK